MSQELQNKMSEALKSLGIYAVCINAKQHRHLAFFDLKLEQGERIRKIEMLIRELGLLLNSKETPILSTCNDRGVVRIKVAFRDADVLPIESLFKKATVPPGTLPFLLGESDS